MIRIQPDLIRTEAIHPVRVEGGAFVIGNQLSWPTLWHWCAFDDSPITAEFHQITIHANHHFSESVAPTFAVAATKDASSKGVF